MPDVPLVPDVPPLPDVPLVPLVPEVPAVPDVPAEPLVPEEPLLPEVPDVPLVPEVPLVPDVAALKEVPFKINEPVMFTDPVNSWLSSKLSPNLFEPLAKDVVIYVTDELTMNCCAIIEPYVCISPVVVREPDMVWLPLKVLEPLSFALPDNKSCCDIVSHNLRSASNTGK